MIAVIPEIAQDCACVQVSGNKKKRLKLIDNLIFFNLLAERMYAGNVCYP